MDHPRLVATDLDGTLLDAHGRVSPYTRRVLVELWERGVETIFVTARPPRWLDALADDVGGHGRAICANGAFLYDVPTRRIVEADCLDVDVTIEIARDLRAVMPDIAFAVEHAGGMHLEPIYRVLDATWLPPSPTYSPIGEIGGLVTGVGKLLARRGEASPEFLTAVADVVDDRGVVAFSGAVGLAEIGPPGVSKASALARWCVARDITPDQVWAFGDMPNDIPMLAWAGRSFAVAGAPRAVVEAATDRCGPNDKDGVARALRSLLR